MTEKEILKELYDEAMDWVFTCSANYLMTIPKKGMEKEHAKYLERAQALERMIERENGRLR